FVQITQGGLWVQEKPDLACLTYYPTGSILIEGQGHIHNAFNFDQKTVTVLRATWFIERNIPTTRTDQPDQVTNDPNVASPPPAVRCPNSALPPAGPGAKGGKLRNPEGLAIIYRSGLGLYAEHGNGTNRR